MQTGCHLACLLVRAESPVIVRVQDNIPIVLKDPNRDSVGEAEQHLAKRVALQLGPALRRHKHTQCIASPSYDLRTHGESKELS